MKAERNHNTGTVNTARQKQFHSIYTDNQRVTVKREGITREIFRVKEGERTIAIFSMTNGEDGYRDEYCQS